MEVLTLKETVYPCEICRAFHPTIEDIAKNVYNRAWACPDCNSRKMHGHLVHKK